MPFEDGRPEHKDSDSIVHFPLEKMERWREDGDEDGEMKMER